LLGVRGYGKAGGKAAGKAAGKATKSDATVTSSSISVDLSGLIGLQTVGLVLFHTFYCTHSLPAVVLGVSIFRGQSFGIASHTFYIFLYFLCNLSVSQTVIPVLSCDFMTPLYLYYIDSY